MEVNKSEAERCRDLGAQALKNGQYERAVKLLQKSLRMYPLPGVEALLAQAQRCAATGATNNNGSSRSNSTTNGNSNSSARSSSHHRAAPPPPSRSESTASSSQTGADGRAYTNSQVEIVQRVLKAKQGGRGAHYRVLGIEQTATESDLKKAYRKLAFKVHPDKNSAPHAAEAFKAVGLAYGTLSDPQKRSIYDRYGDEDPDNRGGGGGGPAGMHFRRGEEMSPEEIFNMFFGGGMGGGARRAGGMPGFHMYTTGFGGGGPQFRHARARARPQQQQQQQHDQGGGASLLQLIPFLLIMIMSFVNFGGNRSGVSSDYMQTKYFSLVQKPPFMNPLHTRLTKVKDIPYFVTDQFLRTYHRDRYQLAQVERLVENSYHQYLTHECQSQRKYRTQLEQEARQLENEEAKERQLLKAKEFELTRCIELEELFPPQARHAGGRASNRAR